jgi:PPE-repeat protein
MLGSAGALMRSVSPVAGIFGNQFQALGSALGSGFGSGTGIFGSPAMGSAAVTAGMGRAASLGVLSVPQSWATAAPAFNSVAPALSAASGVGAAPAAGVGGPGGMVGGMPMLANAARGMGSPVAATPRSGFRPTVVQHPVYAG